MIHWLQTQSTLIIVVSVLAFFYVVAAIVHFLVGRLERSWLAGELKATTPSMLTPLAVLLGLLIAFLASRVWTNIDHANAMVAKEASALRQVVLLSEALPPEPGAQLRELVRQHVGFVIADDWPAMGAPDADSRRLPKTAEDSIKLVLGLTPGDKGQEVAQMRIAVAFEDALAARLGRILLSENAIAPIQWAVIVVLAVLIIFTICMVHLDHGAATAVNLFVFATAVGTCMVLVMVNDRPFAGGDIGLRPAAFEELAKDLKAG